MYRQESMFTGEYERSVDDKGRLVLPSRLRDGLSSTAKLLKGQEHCLYILPNDEWQRQADRVDNVPITDKKTRLFQRMFFGSTESIKLDSNGRLAIGAALRSWSGIESSVTVIGVNTRIELWSPELWAASLVGLETFYEDIDTGGGLIP
jgi:MraZ protein